MENINAETLRKIREEKGMTQGDFARFLGISLRSYQDYEKEGGVIPGAKQELIKLKLYAENAVLGEGYKKAPPEEMGPEDLKSYLSALTEVVVGHQGLMDVELTRIRRNLDEILRVQKETQESVKNLEQKD